VIAAVDTVLRDLLLNEVPSLAPVGGGVATPAQVRFQPPDEKWQAYVSNLAIVTPSGTEHVNALNVYLLDVRENRKLRSNQDVRSVTTLGEIEDEPAPLRVDCHYLVTAWSPAQETPAVEPALDEHALIADVIAVLANHAPLNPSRVYPPGAPELMALPAAIQNEDLPTQVLAPEGFAKLGDFWNAMGARGRWKPGVYLVVTVPVALDRRIAGPPVTTLFGRYRQGADAASEDTVLDIGGLVLDGGGAAVAGAWVRLEAPGGTVLQTATTDDLGRFVFSRVAAQSYVFRAGATGVGTDDRTLDVPAASGEYHLQLT
jgi:hypothetical protein